MNVKKLNIIMSIIHRLDKAVINRIAAGEVIQRPYNALKELIENAIDASSSLIRIQSDGLSFLQIQDNGSGIAEVDLELVCERFATSKLTTVCDLENMSTFGFRGEALASLSHVSHVTITTKMETAPIAYQVTYEDGRLKSKKGCAGRRGTTITIEDLFYNIPIRKRALTSTEYTQMVEMVSKYAVEYSATIGFVCKKKNSTSTDVSTSGGKSVLETIRTIYGHSVAKELMELNSKMEKDVQYECTGRISNANYNLKRSKFILFINRRLVDCPPLKRAIEAVYTKYLPKHTHPFVYLSLKLPASTIDVNVHPTKREVHFLYEDEIIEAIVMDLDHQLLHANTSRTFQTQSLLMPKQLTENQPTSATAAAAATSEPVRKLAPQKFVRTDPKSQTMDKFLRRPLDPLSQSSVRGIKRKEGYPPSTPMEPQLSSIEALLLEVESIKSRVLQTLFKEHTFVGVVDHEFVLIQHLTKLFLLKYPSVLEEFFYQRMLHQMDTYTGLTNVLELPQPMSISTLIQLALDNPDSGWSPDDGDKETLGEEVAKLLITKAKMLQHHFGIYISSDGELRKIPMLLPTEANVAPNLLHLPECILDLATEVDWDIEENCFEGIARAFGKWYSHPPTCMKDVEEQVDEKVQYTWFLTNIFPEMLRKESEFSPPKTLKESMKIMEVACLQKLYRIFERC